MSEEKKEFRDEASLRMLDHMSSCSLETTWDRYEGQSPQCGFGKSGLCCRHCNMGPCNIDPFGDGPQRGVCGADADTFVARGLGACFEWMHEKAIAIGQYFVSSGVFTAFGITLPVFGSAAVTKYLTEEIEQEVGGKWAFGLSTSEMASAMVDHINRKRAALGIDEKRKRVLYDMEARRQLEF